MCVCVYEYALDLNNVYNNIIRCVPRFKINNKNEITYYIFIDKFVCFCVRVYINIYVCMYVCMYICMYILSITNLLFGYTGIN